jgi:positive regulator of sigma E activity
MSAVREKLKMTTYAYTLVADFHKKIRKQQHYTAVILAIYSAELETFTLLKQGWQK